MYLMTGLIIGFLLDCLFGDPHVSWHPICLIGRCIMCMEEKIRNLLPDTQKGQLLGGVLLVVIVSFISTLIPFMICVLAWKIHPVLSIIIHSVLCDQVLAARSLKDESYKVYHALVNGTIQDARYAVSMIVGRDTECLDEKGIIKAAVETVAENTSDGVIAPMLMLAIGGAPLGFFYKAVNTMDSMVGYKNEKYLYFGRAAARLDDILNYIPSRLSGAVMVLAAYFTGMNGKNAMRIFFRDRLKHASPNSAQTEAACAGALEVQLAGDAWYFGKKHEKPFIGDPIREIEREDILRSHRLMYGTVMICLVLCLFVQGVVLICA